MIWFTSDHHFGHENIIKYTNRPFRNADEMDEVMIERWNSAVASDDLVYHLGDFTLFGIENFWEYALALTGRICIIPGGHDKRWLNGFIDQDNVAVLGNLVIRDNILPKKGMHKMALTMCHYPMLSWEQSHYGAPHLHGHTHGTIPVVGESGDTQLPPDQKRGLRIDVGVDTNNFYPYSLEKIIDMLKGGKK